MRTYVSPIGYDTRRVTRPVIRNGIGSQDQVVLIRPAVNEGAERSEQAIRDVKQLLREIEPAADIDVREVSTESLPETSLACSQIIRSLDGDVILSLTGGARDILLPMMMAGLLHTDAIDRTLFFSDLDSDVSEWHLPDLTAVPPQKVHATVNQLLAADGWQSYSTLAEVTDQSKSTVVRHINELADAGLVETQTQGKAKRVRIPAESQLVLEAYNGQFSP